MMLCLLASIGWAIGHPKLGSGDLSLVAYRLVAIAAAGRRGCVHLLSDQIAALTAGRIRSGLRSAIMCIDRLCVVE